MLFQLVIPEFDRQFRKGKIERWFKKEGELVNFGERILDIRVMEFDRLQKFIPEDEDGIDVIRSKSQDWSWTVRVVSSDYGILRKIERQPGEACEIGDQVAVLSIRADESLEANGKPPATFRVIASVVTEAE